MAAVLDRPPRAAPAYPTRQTVPHRKRRRAANPLRRRHWYTGLIIVCGWILPPLAVAVRFGIGADFFVNVVLTCLGWIPGHAHNFWIQNIRNNKNKRHSPAWAVRAGLIKDHRRATVQERQWAAKYADDGNTGGESHYDRQRWQQQPVIVDPVTGETSPDPASPSSSASPIFSSIPLPWVADPAAPSPRDWDDDMPSVSSGSQRRSHAQTPSHSRGHRSPDQFAESLRGANRFSRSQSVRDRYQPHSGERNSSTGASVPADWESGPDDSLKTSTSSRPSERPHRSRRHLLSRRHHAPIQQQYAERYGVSQSSLDSTSDHMHFGPPRDLAGDGDALDAELQSDTLRSCPSTSASIAGNPFSGHAQDRDALRHEV